MTNGHAALIGKGDRWSLCFRRELPHPVERVWQALTERDELERWHPTPFEFEPRVGGKVTYSSDLGPRMPAGEVLTYYPPYTLRHTWGEDELLWSLNPIDEGCRLELLHSFSDRFKAARDGAGWHLCLEALRRSLAGELGGGRPDEGVTEGRLPSGWEELNAEYQEQFEIPPEQATPVPSAPR